tara:strand:- start:89342 stop:89764 length:423 start_codon:yes stop_codon:yes gene_type:complete
MPEFEEIAHKTHTAKQSKAAQRFFRLLSNFESLVEEENFALKEHNFDYIGKLLNQKDTLLKGLIEAKEAAGLGPQKNQELDQRIKLLFKNQEENNVLLRDMMSHTQAELAECYQARKQIKGVQSAYKDQTPTSQKICSEA